VALHARPASSDRRLTIVVLAAALLAGATAARWAVTPGSEPAAGPVTPTPAATTPGPPPTPGSGRAVPAALVDGGLDLRAGPVPVPLELHVPTIGLRTSVVGVGITPEDVMDAPMGRADDAVWQQAFWYRGSAVPGSPSTALIAGHVSGPGGGPGAFARIDDLRPGDPVVVHDSRNGLAVSFAVTESRTYSIDEAAEPTALARIYGAGPVAGRAPQPSPDGLARLTLITCAGTFRNGTHDHRLVVYATRV
jgi:sortase (surface protein transpeptidase)